MPAGPRRADAPCPLVDPPATSPPPLRPAARPARQAAAPYARPPPSAPPPSATPGRPTASSALTGGVPRGHPPLLYPLSPSFPLPAPPPRAVGLPLPPRRLPTIARSAPAAALLSTDAAVAFTTVLKEAVRIAKALPEGQVQDAAEDLQLSLLRVPGARASLDLLPGLRLPGQLVNFLRSAGEVLISDAACASSALADWCAERRSSPAVESLDVAKPALVNEARDMMGRAPPETDWGLLGSALAVALPALPLGVRVGLMEGTSRDTLWAFVVQAVVRADSGVALDTIRTVLSAALSPGASEPAWVADALPGPVHPPPLTPRALSPPAPSSLRTRARARRWPRSPARPPSRPPARPWRQSRGLPLLRGPYPTPLKCGCGSPASRGGPWTTCWPRSSRSWARCPRSRPRRRAAGSGTGRCRPPSGLLSPAAPTLSLSRPAWAPS